MNTSSPLRLRKSVPSAAYELPSSFLNRVAWANGFLTGDEFCSTTGLSRLDALSVSRQSADTLAMWTGTDATALQAFSMPSGKVVRYGFSTVKRNQLSKTGVRYCPHCLHEDVIGKRGGAVTGYIRGPWQWRMISHCPDHGCLLRQDAIGILHLENYSSLIGLKSRSELAEPVIADRYFFDRLTEQASTAFLDEFPAYVSAEFCALLGHFRQALHIQTINERIAGGVENWDLRRKGFEIAVHGRDAVWAFLTEYVADASKRTNQPRRIYSPFLRWWTVNKHSSDYQMLFNLFKDHAEQHVTLDPGESFVALINKRKIFTLSSAARHYGLSEKWALRVLQAKMGTTIVPVLLSRGEMLYGLSEAASVGGTSETSIVLVRLIEVCQGFMKAAWAGLAPNRDYRSRARRPVHQFSVAYDLPERQQGVY